MVRREFSRFSMPRLDPDLVHTSGMLEWLERIATRSGWRDLARRIDRIGNQRFGNQLENLILASGNAAVWGYDGKAFSTFEIAKKHGRRCILDRTIGDWRAYNSVMTGLQENYSEWFLPTTRVVPDVDIATDEREYGLADYILVGSEFAAETVRHHARAAGTAEKIRVLNYCYDEALFANAPASQPVDRSGPVKFLFLGLVTPRKGIQHVLEAMEQLPPSEAQLTVVGPMQMPESTFARFADRISYRPHVPRAEVPAIMAEHHVLLFPSYFEGAGIVLYEALASGLGLIQSDQAALAVTDATGILLDRIGTEELLAAMRKPIEDRDLLDSWRAAGPREAEQYSFANYRAGIARFLAEAGL